MSAVSAAVASDASTTAGTTPYPPATSGTWTAGSVTTESYSKLTIGGSPVIYQASCTFSFSGTTSSTPPVTVTGTDMVTLSPSTTKLQKNENNVLRDGDSITSIYGNEISISASHKLRSA